MACVPFQGRSTCAPQDPVRPALPGAYAGATMPRSMYMTIEPAPRRAPSAPPPTRTANVWPVIGTVVQGTRTTNWALRATSRAKPAISAKSRAQEAALLASGWTGTNASARVRVARACKGRHLLVESTPFMPAPVASVNYFGSQFRNVKWSIDFMHGGERVGPGSYRVQLRLQSWPLAAPLPAAAEARVPHIAQGVAEHVEGEHRQRQGQSGPDRQHRVGRVLARGVKHPA